MRVTLQCVCAVVGLYCEIRSSYCQTVGNAVCQNGATCVNEDDGYHCVCAAGYTGQFCLPL